MALFFNGVEIKQLFLNNSKMGSAYLNGVQIFAAEFIVNLPSGRHNNVDIRNFLSGWDPSAKLIVNVPAGAVYGSTSTSQPAFRCEVPEAREAVLNVAGGAKVVGKGGNGGKGGDAISNNNNTKGRNGGSGGTGMIISKNFARNIIGLVAGGGGGGGGGGAVRNTSSILWSGSGGGGGAGEGAPGSYGGLAGSSPTMGVGNVGVAGTIDAGGAGGASIGRPNVTAIGAGGKGGNPNQNGEDGYPSFFNQIPSNNYGRGGKAGTPIIAT